MPLIASDKGGGMDFVKCPAGAWPAVCTQVVDLGLQTSNFDGKAMTKHKVMLGWQVDCDLQNEDGSAIMVFKRYTLSLNENANLRSDLDNWRGKPFTPEELEGFELKAILGAPCQIQAAHKERDGKVYVNVSAVMRLGKGQTAPKPQGDLIYFAIDEWKAGDGKMKAAFETFGDNLKKTILEGAALLEAQKHFGTAVTGEDTTPSGDEIPF